MEEYYDFDGVIFKPVQFTDAIRLKAETPEDESHEYKGFGKLMHFTDRSKKYQYQPRELKETIMAFLNTNGGCIFLGVADNNGMLKGGDYTLEDKDKLGIFLKNFAACIKIGGLGLIKYNFHKIPKKYQIKCEDKNVDDRCLAVIKVHKSPIPIIYDNVIIVREMNTNTKISLDEWNLRMKIHSTFELFEPLKPSIFRLQKSYASVV